MSYLTAIPEMLQFLNTMPANCWKTEGLPHSAGRVPDSPLDSISRSIRAGKEPLLPQETGRVPTMGVFLI